MRVKIKVKEMFDNWAPQFPCLMVYNDKDKDLVVMFTGAESGFTLVRNGEYLMGRGCEDGWINICQRNHGTGDPTWLPCSLTLKHQQ